MAWGNSKASTPPSTASQILPLIITLAIIVVVGWVLYQTWISVVKIQDQASKQMGNKNVVVTREGVRVGVKHVETERYVEATQSWVVKAWNLRGSAKEEARNRRGDAFSHK